MRKWILAAGAALVTATPAGAFEPKIAVPPCVEARHAHLQPQFPVCGSEEGIAAVKEQIAALTPTYTDEQTICTDRGRCITTRYKVWDGANTARQPTETLRLDFRTRPLWFGR